MTCRKRVEAAAMATLLAVSLVGLPEEVFAQNRPGAQGGGRAGRAIPPGGVTPGELQTMFDGYVLMQAQETLQLSDEQFPRFIPRLKTLQEARRRSQIARSRLIAELRRMTQPNAEPDEAQLRQQISALDALDTKSAAEIAQAAAAVDEVLTPRQQARFRIFEETMEQRKVELLLRARQANRQPNRF
jgi:Spy/CpxP family protein refolding chaperone